MPKIKIHVSSNNASNGVLSVRVTPWRVHLDKDDTATWELDGGQPTKNDILWFRVEQIDSDRPWPFLPPEPPDSIYTGQKSNGYTVTSPKKNNNANPNGAVIRYGLTICFNDDGGRKRIMYIDPDMVIDS